MSLFFRRRRFRYFTRLVNRIKKEHLRILDVGGTAHYWHKMGYTGHHAIVLINKMPQQVLPNMVSVVGDARCLRQFRDGEFDIVFSNSVIEHLGSFDSQKMMADEIRRVGKRYYVQTPSFWFPIEPHYMLPLIHWLPKSAQLMVKKIMHPRLSKEELRLMTESELRQLFPDAEVIKEKFLLLTKSYVVLKWQD